MKVINFTAIYVLWLREMKRYARAKSRIIGTLAMPLFFLVSFGLGFNQMAIPGMKGVSYIIFLVPGIVGMSMLFTSMFSGISVLWDREFGFLKEIMVAPVNRISIVLGRIAGGVTTAILQGLMILVISYFIGFRIPSIFGLTMALVFMLLIGITYIGLGLIFASRMRDMQGFSLIMNFIIFPTFIFSGAIFPLSNLPFWLNDITYINPLRYGVNGLRVSLINASQFSLGFNLLMIFGFAVIMVIIGAISFENSDSV